MFLACCVVHSICSKVLLFLGIASSIPESREEEKRKIVKRRRKEKKREEERRRREKKKKKKKKRISLIVPPSRSRWKLRMNSWIYGKSIKEE